MQPDAPQPPLPPLPISTPPKVPSPHRQRNLLIGCLVGCALIVAGTIWWAVGHTRVKYVTKTADTSNTQQPITTKTTTPTVKGLQLDPAKNYGNAYANGLLPVGDNKYVTDTAKKGNIYICRANFVPAGQAGAQVRGPWFVNNNTQWDSNKKSAIQGNVQWQQNITMSIASGKRVISTNDLPDHHTGVFPVQANDPARKYDANPNRITSQSLTYNLDAAPSYGDPSCVGGEVGVMITGVALFDGFDAGGRDAGAWEVQDTCDGHPQNKGEYHYHTLSRCIVDTSVQKVIGYALDGFPITGPKVGDNNILTTDDLDECHGLTSQIVLDGKQVTSYHYVMTQDFPYSVSCFRGTAIQPPGRPE